MDLELFHDLFLDFFLVEPVEEPLNTIRTASASRRGRDIVSVFMGAACYGDW